MAALGCSTPSYSDLTNRVVARIPTLQGQSFLSSLNYPRCEQIIQFERLLLRMGLWCVSTAVNKRRRMVRIASVLHYFCFDNLSNNSFLFLPNRSTAYWRMKGVS